MKSIYISITIFLFMIIGILLSIQYINNVSHNLMVTCENIEGYIYLEKWEDAYESSITVLENWDTNSEMMSLYYNSAELDSLNNEIVRLTQFTKSKSKSDSLASIHLVKYLIKQMKGIQELKIHNIL